MLSAQMDQNTRLWKTGRRTLPLYPFLLPTAQLMLQQEEHDSIDHVYQKVGLNARPAPPRFRSVGLLIGQNIHRM